MQMKERVGCFRARARPYSWGRFHRCHRMDFPTPLNLALAPLLFEPTPAVLVAEVPGVPGVDAIQEDVAGDDNLRRAVENPTVRVAEGRVADIRADQVTQVGSCLAVGGAGRDLHHQ